MIVKKKLKADIILTYDNQQYDADDDAEAMTILGVEQYVNSLGMINVLGRTKKGMDVGIRLHIKEDDDGDRSQ